jgi:hypothetical protein
MGCDYYKHFRIIYEYIIRGIQYSHNISYKRCETGYIYANSEKEFDEKLKQELLVVKKEQIDLTLSENLHIIHFVQEDIQNKYDFNDECILYTDTISESEILNYIKVQNALNNLKCSKDNNNILLTEIQSRLHVKDKINIQKLNFEKDVTITNIVVHSYRTERT